MVTFKTLPSQSEVVPAQEYASSKKISSPVRLGLGVVMLDDKERLDWASPFKATSKAIPANARCLRLKTIVRFCTCFRNLTTISTSNFRA